MANNAGIKDWDIKKAKKIVLNGKKLTVTNHEYMAEITMVGVIKLASEQGTWAAEAAKKLLGGLNPKNIPVVTNSINKTILNEELLLLGNFSKTSKK